MQVVGQKDHCALLQKAQFFLLLPYLVAQAKVISGMWFCAGFVQKFCSVESFKRYDTKV